MFLTFADDVEELAGPWEGWAPPDAPPVVHLARLDLSDEGSRIGGAFVTGAPTVLGLRAWDDASEGVFDGTPYALFDIEKLFRMMLHQSGLAFEILTSPWCWTRTAFDPRRVADAAVTRGVLDYYRAVGQPVLEGESRELWRWRSVLTAWLLTHRTAVSHRLETLVEHTGDNRLEPLLEGHLPDASLLRPYWEALSPEASLLGAKPRDYDYIDTHLVMLRAGVT